MRVPGIRGDSAGAKRALSSIVGAVSGTKTSDLANVMEHRPELYGRVFGEWLDGLLRGDSSWSVGERELFASYTAARQSCEFGSRTHGAVAALELGEQAVRQAWEDPGTAPVSDRVKAALRLIGSMTGDPEHLDRRDIQPLREAGLGDGEIEEVIQICAALNIIARIADTLEFDVPPWKQCLKGAKVALRRGYARP